MRSRLRLAGWLSAEKETVVLIIEKHFNHIGPDFVFFVCATHLHC